MVAWKGGRQVADVPRIKLNLPPGSWLGLTTAAGLAAALWWDSSQSPHLHLCCSTLLCRHSFQHCAAHYRMFQLLFM